jgi:hypothetical protein
MAVSKVRVKGLNKPRTNKGKVQLASKTKRIIWSHTMASWDYTAWFDQSPVRCSTCVTHWSELELSYSTFRALTTEPARGNTKIQQRGAVFEPGRTGELR